MDNQNWERHSKSLTPESIIEAIEAPSEFQLDFLELLQDYVTLSPSTPVLEAGCEQAVISWLLADKTDAHALDINKDILGKLSIVREKTQKKLTIIDGDLFDIANSEAKNYDLIHNTGVLEHFNSIERKQILNQLTSLLKPGGKLIIGIPNHHSLPYRTAYLFHNLIFRGLFWKWPSEFKIKNLNDDAPMNLKFVAREVLATETAFRFWRPFKLIGKIFRIIHRIRRFEGYLEVYVYEKK